MSFDQDLQAISESQLSPLPEVHVGDRDLADVTADALQALQAANEPPALFCHGNTLVRVVVDRLGVATIETHSRTTLRYQLARVASWRKIVRQREGERVIAVSPPYDVVDDILAAPGWDFPRLDRVVHAPGYGPDGTLRVAAGYHPSGVWHQPHSPFDLAIPERPSADQIAAARVLICKELLGDFPFVGDAERAHAVALFLLPFVRDLIDGPTPLHLVEAPTVGTGKGLLVDVTLQPGLGHLPDALPDTGSDEEWRKRLTTKLKQGASLILIDNLSGPLDSGALSAALTTRSWEDRLLGQNKTIVVPVRCCWATTGNNPVLSSELARRTVRIRLDSSVERPWLRDGFRHPDLRDWADCHRRDITAAALTILQAWIAAGRPSGDQVLGSYETWAHTLGGILDVAGVPGFLANLDDFYEGADTETQSLYAFVAEWWRLHQERPVTAADLWRIAGKVQPALPIGDGNEHSQRTRFGFWLKGQRDRVVGHYRIRSAGSYQNAVQWRLEHPGSEK